jgi:carbon-monoxide dehydrogenase large subunit
MERLLDRIARELDMDRAELRRKNLIQPEKLPYEKPIKSRAGAPIIYDSGDYPACQAELLRQAGWDSFAERQRLARDQGRYIGIGLAHGLKGTGRGPFESATVRVTGTGVVSVLTGAAAIGQGLVTALSQICAEQLGMRPQDVRVIHGDTAVVPWGLGAFASRQTVTAGSSVHLAARAVAEKARKLGGMMMQMAPDELEVADGQVRVKGDPSRAIALAELARILRGGPGYAFPPGFDPGLEATASFRTDLLAYANACHVAEVEVDIDTAQVRVTRYFALHDSGVRINPMIVDGQTHGSISHGLGNALYEWMGYDTQGQPTTTTFADYLMPTATELPHFATSYRQSPSPMNPLGVKGAGEAGVIPASPAVMSAIENALSPFGIRIAETPLLPARLYALIAEARTRGKQ